PGSLLAPIDVLIRLPHVLATTTETEGLEPHRFQSNVAGENHQIGPRDLTAILLLDRPEQTTRLVQADVVRPAIEWREPLLTSTAPAAAIPGPVGPRAVPGHADEQRPVVTEVRRPPVLRVAHQIREVLFHPGQI